MSGIEQRSGCVWYYGNPAGYIDRDTAVVDTMEKIYVYADFDFLGEKELIGELSYNRVREHVKKNICVNQRENKPLI